MSTLEEFVRREAAATRHFMDRYVMDDFLNGHASYSREYRCDCGFRCSDSRRIYEHSAVCHPSVHPDPTPVTTDAGEGDAK